MIFVDKVGNEQHWRCDKGRVVKPRAKRWGDAEPHGMENPDVTPTQASGQCITDVVTAVYGCVSPISVPFERPRKSMCNLGVIVWCQICVSTTLSGRPGGSGWVRRWVLLRRGKLMLEVWSPSRPKVDASERTFDVGMAR